MACQWLTLRWKPAHPRSAGEVLGIGQVFPLSGARAGVLSIRLLRKVMVEMTQDFLQQLELHLLFYRSPAFTTKSAR